MIAFGQKYLLLTAMLYSISVFATNAVPSFPDKGVIKPDNRSFIDPNVDYSRFAGRVTDKDATGRILKVKVENNNTKFFKAGDKLEFHVNNHKTDTPCQASVRRIEDYYFVMYVKNFNSCWKKGQYFPRGMQLVFKSQKLQQRVFEASKFREQLLLRKDGYLRQLSNINNYIWTFDQQKMKEASQYDEQINELIRKKQIAMDTMLHAKQENLILQVELQQKLNSLDNSLEHYKVERQEYLIDRWNMDHDTAMEFSQRPLKFKKP